MEFEYDPNKSASNKVKHGVDFEEAKRLWDGPYTIVPVERDCGEQRYVVIGIMDGKHWTAITTMREGRTRIISVRRSHKNEEAIYGQDD